MLNSNNIAKATAEMDQSWEILLEGFQLLDNNAKLALIDVIEGKNINALTIPIILCYARTALQECIIRDLRRKLEEKDG